MSTEKLKLIEEYKELEFENHLNTPDKDRKQESQKRMAEIRNELGLGHITILTIALDRFHIA